MSKKNHTPNGSLLSLELREVISRLQEKEPELTEIMDREKGAKTMASRRVEMGKRYNELLKDGLSSNDAVAQVNREFGTNINANSIRSYGGLARKAKQERPTTPPVDDTTGKSAADTIDLAESTTPDIPHHTDDVVRVHESLTDEELKTLRKIIVWWQTGGQQTAERLRSINVEDLKARPVFPGPKFNSGIRVSKRLLDAARAKCESPEEKRRTGGSISSLVECLLWDYLNNNPRFLKEQPDPAPEEPEAGRRVDDTSMTA